ncbi:MAG: hypothetical protein U1F23_02455 [Lysobacterales bacterium]
MPRDTITACRQRCARWACALWATGTVPPADRVRLGRCLRDIANGTDARDVLGVRYAGRPRKLDIPALDGTPHDGGAWLTFADGGRVRRVPAAQALDTAERGDTEQARWVLGLIACAIEQGMPLPTAWTAYLAGALHAVAAGEDARQALLLVRPRGNTASPLQDEGVRFMADTLRAFAPDFADHPTLEAKLIARFVETSAKGTAKTLTEKRIRQVLGKKPRN